MSAAIRALIAIAVTALPAGCDGLGDDLPELHPLVGTVVRDGKPVCDGLLRFHPTRADSGVIVNAAVGSDGTFAAETGRADDPGGRRAAGAPAGSYRVVYLPPAEDQKASQPLDVASLVTVGPRSNKVTIVLPGKK